MFNVQKIENPGMKWNRISNFAKQNLPDRKNVRNLRDIYFYKYIKLCVILCKVLIQQNIVNMIMLYEIQAHLKKEISASFSYK